MIIVYVHVRVNAININYGILLIKTNICTFVQISHIHKYHIYIVWSVQITDPNPLQLNIKQITDPNPLQLNIKQITDPKVVVCLDQWSV
jgi:hypothetical protein